MAQQPTKGKESQFLGPKSKANGCKWHLWPPVAGTSCLVEALVELPRQGNETGLSSKPSNIKPEHTAVGLRGRLGRPFNHIKGTS